MRDERGRTDGSSEEACRVLGEVHEALEQVLPPGLVRPASETLSLISMELDAVIAAIRSMAEVIPSEVLTDRIVWAGV